MKFLLGYFYTFVSTFVFTCGIFSLLINDYTFTNLGMAVYDAVGGRLSD